MPQKTKGLTITKALPYILIIGGIIGIICSLFLTYDQIKIWQNPNYHPACTLNPVVSCGTVINSKQGDILGIPGPFFGLVVFPVLITIGVAILAGGAFKRWLWQGLGLGLLGGVAFALWLFWISLYRVHALCPFCLVVDVVVYTVFWYVTLYSLDQGHIRIPKSLDKPRAFVRRHHFDVLLFWFILVGGFILKHFWYYYGKHL